MKTVFLSAGARENTLIHLLESGIEISGIVTPKLTAKNNRFKGVIDVANTWGISHKTVNKTNLKDTLETLDFELMLSCGFNLILEPSVINMAKYAINVHPTLLPAYRGYRSAPYIIMNGEKKSGVTVHFISEEMDDGDIIAQQEFDLTPFDTNKSHYRKCQTIEPELVLRAIKSLANGSFNRSPQDNTKATVYNYMRTPKDSEIDWNKSLRQLYDEIRACDPEEYPAFFYVKGEKVCIKLWRPNKPKDQEDEL